MSGPGHRIRLRHPWQQTSDDRGTCWRRRFNRPTGIETGCSLAIAVEGLASPGQVVLNGVPLGGLEPASAVQRFPIGTDLPLHNELALQIEGPSGPPQATCPPCEVALEIVDTD